MTVQMIVSLISLFLLISFLWVAYEMKNAPVMEDEFYVNSEDEETPNF